VEIAELTVDITGLHTHILEDVKIASQGIYLAKAKFLSPANEG